MPLGLCLPWPLCWCLSIALAPGVFGVFFEFRGSEPDRGAMARPCPRVAPPPQKPFKTNEKSMIRALEPPGTSPERSGTAEDHLKARSNHPRAAQDRPVRPPRRPVRPPRRHVVCPGSNFVCPGSSSVCPGSNSVCPGNTKFIEILLEK